MLLFTVGGIANKAVSIIVFIIGTFQLINFLFRGEDLLNSAMHIAPLYLISILIYKHKYNLIFSLSCVAIGVLTTVLNEDIQNYAGSVFIGCAFFFIPHVYYGVFLIVTTITSISIKANLYDLEFNTALSLLFAYLLVYSILYFVVYRQIKKKEHEIDGLNQKMQREVNRLNREIKELKDEIDDLKKNPPEKLKNIDFLNIKEEEKGMLKLFSSGMSYENISRFLGLNNAHDTIRRKITKIKRDCNKKTDAEFVKWLYDSV